MSTNRKDITGENNPFKKSLDNSPEKRKQHKERCKKLWENRDKEWRKAFAEKLSARSIEKSGNRGKTKHEKGVHMSMKAEPFS